MIFNRELSLVYDASGRSLAEFLIQINEDRPGILAAIGNAYADHGVNIINISYNRNQKMIHIIADMSGSDMGMGELEELLKKFSFVSGVVEKPLESNAHLIPSLSLPTFWGRRVVVIDMDMLVSIGAPIFKIVQEMGRLDRSRLSDISPQMLRLVQLRGLARIDLVVVGSTVRAKLCNEDGLDLAMNYLEGLLGEIPYRVYKSKESEACVELEISKL
ncbi:hypothetical protein GCM10007981_19100 [Thermocladium modestius]|uniref:ACT domain-containing protein n=1 Tax=Thermocladium modestius TaxID=62609 RepID=A0A830GWX8_9CREN|nr:hypothetical protein [Thermocladium modestius]GGP22557.1 hypothetical protein GCM10007981_19100 [Thermocladium modestius]